MLSHLFLVLSSYTLPRGTLKAISKGIYSIEELDEIFEFVKSEYRRYRKKLKRSYGNSAIMSGFCFKSWNVFWTSYENRGFFGNCFNVCNNIDINISCYICSKSQ